MDTRLPGTFLEVVSGNFASAAADDAVLVRWQVCTDRHGGQSAAAPKIRTSNSPHGAKPIYGIRGKVSY
jgi:hypothetical protein